MSKSRDNQWRKFIEPLDAERTDLQRILDGQEKIYDLFRNGMISRELYTEKMTVGAETKERILEINGLVYSMIEAWQAGEDPLIWKLSRP